MSSSAAVHCASSDIAKDSGLLVETEGEDGVDSRVLGRGGSVWFVWVFTTHSFTL
jgi:hypothetical protein